MQRRAIRRELRAHYQFYRDGPPDLPLTPPRSGRCLIASPVFGPHAPQTLVLRQSMRASRLEYVWPRSAKVERCFAKTIDQIDIGARTLANASESAAPVFNLQSLPAEDALEDAGLRVDEAQSLSIMPCVVWRSLQMRRTRDWRARNHHDVPLALVVVASYLFMGEPVWPFALLVMGVKRLPGPQGL